MNSAMRIACIAGAVASAYLGHPVLAGWLVVALILSL